MGVAVAFTDTAFGSEMPSAEGERMTSAVEPTLDKINTSIEGFFWALPNIAIALVTFLLFIIGAWVAKRAIIGVFSRRHRADLGGFGRHRSRPVS